MKIIQTLYASNSSSAMLNTFGWLSAEYHLMSWTLSCLQLKKYYEKVYLFANSAGADLLINQLNLPYDSVQISHEKLELPHKDLWALPKIYTYSIQEEPFLHVDGDVFLFSKFPENLLKQKLIVQNLEESTEYYDSIQSELMYNLSYFPDCVNKDFYSNQTLNSVNAGILGGNHIPFIKNYTSEAFMYIDKNIEHLSAVNVNKSNVFFEQHLFYSLAQQENIPVSVLLNEVYKDDKYGGLGDFHEVPYKKTYLHLLGNYKRNVFVCRQMANKLRQLYPEYYYHIIALFKRNNIPLLDDYLSKREFITQESFLSFHNLAEKSFISNDFSKQTKNNIHREEGIIDTKVLSKLYNSLEQIDYTDKGFTKHELTHIFQSLSDDTLNKFFVSPEQAQGMACTMLPRIQSM